MFRLNILTNQEIKQYNKLNNSNANKSKAIDNMVAAIVMAEVETLC